MVSYRVRSLISFAQQKFGTDFLLNLAYCAVMDFTLALLPWRIVWALQMKRVEKIGVAVAMSMGFA